MSVIQTEVTAIAAAPVITIKGAGKAKRELAYMQIAPLAFIETLSRADMIANLRVALGASPTEAEVKTAQSEVTIGRVAARLPAGEFPKGTYQDDSARLDFARKLVLHYAAPAQEGKQARKLRAGQLGRRTVIQHKVVRAADEAWSQIKAELGLGQAQTQATRAKVKKARSTNANPVRGDGKGLPTTAETVAYAKGLADASPSAALAKPAKALDADSACNHVESMAANLLAFCNKNAKLLPTDYGMAVQAFKQAVNKAANERALRKATVEAENAKRK